MDKRETPEVEPVRRMVDQQAPATSAVAGIPVRVDRGDALLLDVPEPRRSGYERDDRPAA